MHINKSTRNLPEIYQKIWWTHRHQRRRWTCWDTTSSTAQRLRALHRALWALRAQRAQRHRRRWSRHDLQELSDGPGLMGQARGYEKWGVNRIWAKEKWGNFTKMWILIVDNMLSMWIPFHHIHRKNGDNLSDINWYVVKRPLEMGIWGYWMGVIGMFI